LEHLGSGLAELPRVGGDFEDFFAGSEEGGAMEAEDVGVDGREDADEVHVSCGASGFLAQRHRCAVTDFVDSRLADVFPVRGFGEGVEAGSRIGSHGLQFARERVDEGRAKRPHDLLRFFLRRGGVDAVPG
jgi:hypothetical protein